MKPSNTRVLLLLVILSCFLIQGCMLRGGSLLNTRTANFPLSDAAPRQGGFAETGLDYYSYEFGSIINFGVRGEYAVSDKLAFGAELGYGTENPDEDEIEGESGALDPRLTGWYSPYSDNRTNIALGARITLPAGSEDFNQGYFDYGAFVTARYLLTEKLVGVGQIGVDFYEPFFEDEDREATFSGRGSLMYNVADGADIFGEFYFQDEPEFAFRPFRFDFLKGGLGLQLSENTDFRAAFGTGLGDETETLDFFGEVRLGLTF